MSSSSSSSSSSSTSKQVVVGIPQHNQYQVLVQQPSVIQQPVQSYVQQPVQTVVQQPAQVAVGQSQIINEVPQSQIISSQIIQSPEKAEIKVIGTEYLPVTRTEMVYEEQGQNMFIPIYKKIRDYYVIEHQVIRVPEYEYTTYYEYVPEDRQIENVTYRAIEKSVVHEQPYQGKIDPSLILTQDKINQYQLTQSQMQLNQSIPIPVQGKPQVVSMSQVLIKDPSEFDDKKIGLGCLLCRAPKLKDDKKK